MAGIEETCPPADSCSGSVPDGNKRSTTANAVKKKPTQKGRFLVFYMVMMSCRKAPPEFRFASSTLRNFVPSGAAHEAAAGHALSEPSDNYPATCINGFSTTIIML